jgi:hypothetical protein
MGQVRKPELLEPLAAFAQKAGDLFREMRVTAQADFTAAQLLICQHDLWIWPGIDAVIAD